MLRAVLLVAFRLRGRVAFLITLSEAKMYDHWRMIESLNALLAKDDVSDDTKALIQAFRNHADKVEDRLKDLEKLTRDMKNKSMLN
jgi:hypothetical protein